MIFEFHQEELWNIVTWESILRKEKCVGKVIEKMKCSVMENIAAWIRNMTLEENSEDQEKQIGI